MGIETEYGVLAPGDPKASPMLMSGQVVNAYAQPLAAHVGRARWDYEDEAPLCDARGFSATPMAHDFWQRSSSSVASFRPWARASSTR